MEKRYRNKIIIIIIIIIIIVWRCGVENRRVKARPIDLEMNLLCSRCYLF